jgi:hypothetical protein
VSQVSAIRGPEKSQLEQLQQFLSDDKGGDCFQLGSEAFTWTETDVGQYLCLNASLPQDDLFTRFIMNTISLIFHRLVGEQYTRGRIIDEESGLKSYNDEKLHSASNMIAAIVAAILPVLTIFALNSLGTTTARIGLTVLFTALFAVLLVVFTSAKGVEIFAATAT